MLKQVNYRFVQQRFPDRRMFGMEEKKMLERLKKYEEYISRIRKEKQQKEDTEERESKTKR